MKNAFITSVCLAALTLPPGLCQSAAGQSPNTVTIRLHEPLSSASSQVGDRFTGTLSEPLVMNGRIVAAKDAVVIGHVGEVISSFGRYSRSALITLRLTSIQSRTGRYPLGTSDLVVKANSRGERSVLIIGGSAGTGAVIGGAAATGKGGAAEASAGRVLSLLDAKHEIALPSDMVLTFYVTTLTLQPKELAQQAQPADLPVLSAAVFN